MARGIASTRLSSKILNYVVGLGHSQAEVARLLGVTEGFVSLVKGQKRSFTLTHLDDLADGIGMPLGEMMIQATERPNASKKARATMDRLARIVRLGDKARAAIRGPQAKRRARVA